MEEEIPASNPHNFEDRVEQHMPEKDLYMNGVHHKHLVTWENQNIFSRLSTAYGVADEYNTLRIQTHS